MDDVMPRCCCPAGFLFPNLPLERRLDGVAASGIRGVELWARADRYRDLDVASVSAERVRRLCRDRGLTVVSLAAHPPTDTAHVRSAVDLAAELGAETVVIGCKGESVADALLDLRPAFAHAARVGVRIAVHNHVNGLIREADDMARSARRSIRQPAGSPSRLRTR